MCRLKLLHHNFYMWTNKISLFAYDRSYFKHTKFVWLTCDVSMCIVFITRCNKKGTKSLPYHFNRHRRFWCRIVCRFCSRLPTEVITFNATCKLICTSCLKCMCNTKLNIPDHFCSITVVNLVNKCH